MKGWLLFQRRGFGSQHPHRGLQLSVTLVPEDPTPSSAFHEHQAAPMPHARKQNTYTHTIIKYTSGFQKRRQKSLLSVSR